MRKFSWWWSEGTHENWRALRTKGCLHYILIRGVLSWGLPMFLMMTMLHKNCFADTDGFGARQE